MADPNWEDADFSWGGVELTSKNFLPVYVDGTSFYVLGEATDTALEANLERRAALFVPGRVVQANRIWPDITGPDGGTVSIKLGAHDTPDGAISWEGPYTFTIGTDVELDFCVSGKYIAVHFSSSATAGWKLQSYQIDYEVIGTN